MSSENVQTVELRRSVRYGRLLIGGAVLGALVASLITIFTPIPDGALYTLGQITGFMLLIGGVIGLAVGGLLALLLTLVARRQHGTGSVVAVEEPIVTVVDEAPAEVPADENEPVAGPSADAEKDAAASADAQVSDTELR